MQHQPGCASGGLRLVLLALSDEDSLEALAVGRETAEA